MTNTGWGICFGSLFKSLRLEKRPITYVPPCRVKKFINLTNFKFKYLGQRSNQSVPNFIELIFLGLPPEKADGVFEVPDAEAQESYIFNKFGQHVITKDLMTGTTKFKMSYTQTTSTGKEVQIRD